MQWLRDASNGRRVAQAETEGDDLPGKRTGGILMNMFKSIIKRNIEYWKTAVEYHERELAMQRRLLKRARAKLAQAEKEAKETANDKSS